ncbi:sirohydrochlorin cobaltochelatase, partial [Desulfovibrio sp. OttesenSCG-928-G11]|nr:sirohydrochlorin cobaltochelatase [Desulfovibrio sp. OttesenSCG-928-G11]
LPLVRERFPDREVVVPFTSGVIRDKLNAAIGDAERKILSPAQMLEKLKADGYRDIAVVCTLLFAGIEYDKLKKEVESFSAANAKIKVSLAPPLLADPANFKPVINALGKYMLTDASNIVVAHGSHAGHPVEAHYLELAALLAENYPNARMGSVEGAPDMAQVMEWVKGRKNKEVRFIVFMFVAGDHAENDIASDDEDSLFSAVRAMGKSPSAHMVDTKIGKRMASLGLDPDYRKLLLDYYVSKVPR